MKNVALLVGLALVLLTGAVFKGGKSFFFKSKDSSKMAQQAKVVPASGNLLYVGQGGEIVLNNPGGKISSLALRLIAESNGSFPKVIPSEDLKKNGWTFPIKRVYKEKDDIVIDLAAVNLSTEGYEVGKFVKIGEIDLSASGYSVEDFKFDTDQTHVILKNGEEVELKIGE